MCPATYPADIDPNSGCRLPLPVRHPNDAAAQMRYDQLARPDGPSIRGLRGPAGIGLHSPGLCKVSGKVVHYLRHESGMPARVRETAILITARELDSQFEWAAHESEARKAGVPDITIETIRHHKPTEGLDATDAIIIRLGREIFRSRKLSSTTYAVALEIFGIQLLVDLVELMGSYASTAVRLIAFDMQLDPGVEPPLPQRDTILSKKE